MERRSHTTRASGLPTSRLGRTRERIGDELSRTAEKRQALDRFESAVQSVEAASVAGGDVRTTTNGTLTGAGGDRTAGRRRVRSAFEEHVEPLSGDVLEEPDTVHEAIATELSRDVAVALAGTGTSTGLSPHLKQAVLDESSSRRRELELMTRTLERERESVATASATLDDVREWLDARTDVRLFDRAFETLVDWHGRLDAHVEALDAVAARRQAHLDRTTGLDATVALRHWTLAEYLYAEFPVTYPVLDECASLASACLSAQRAVRGHVARRV